MWTIDQIEHEWIGANVAALARPADRVIEAFDRVESVLGRDWMERSRGGVGESKPVGTNPALVVVKMGEHLTLLDGVNGAERLIERIRKGDLSAQGELCAIYLLLRSQKPHVASVDLYPAVGNREADFRVKLRDEKQWTYVEVTQLDESEAHERAREIVQRIATIVKEIQHSVALEAFLRRIPTDSEITAILARIPTFCGTHAASREDLPNSLGFLSLNQSAPGQVVVHDHAGEENVPRLGVAKAISGKDEIPRHVSVRMAFTDDRAVKMLHDEAGQLSTEAPGLIMAGVARATGAIRTWEPALTRRFQPEIHTRVGGVFLWMGGMCQTPRGVDQLFSTRSIVNPHAKLPLPSWISEALDGIGDEFGKVENPAAG